MFNPTSDMAFLNSEAVRSAQRQRQQMVDAAQAIADNTAPVIGEWVCAMLNDFYSTIDPSMALGVATTGTPSGNVIIVDNVGYIASSLLVFCGKDSSGNPARLIQHIGQLNLLLTAVPTNEPTKRQIGFVGDLAPAQ